jgi:hypothetical protein
LGGQQKSSPSKLNHQGQGQGFNFDSLDEQTKHVVAGLFVESLRLSARNAERQQRGENEKVDVDGTKRVVVEDDKGKQSAKQGEGVTGTGM